MKRLINLGLRTIETVEIIKDDVRLVSLNVFTFVNGIGLEAVALVAALI